MAPVFFQKVPFLDYPVDFGKRWRGRPLFGSHKTFRGFFFGILGAIILVYIQRQLFISSAYFRDISFIDYSAHNFILLGFLIGLGVLLGDLVESFFKRRSSIKPGKPWIPWDQLDWVLGMLILLAFVYVPPLSVLAFIIIAFPLLHILFKHIGYYLGINTEKW